MPLLGHRGFHGLPSQGFNSAPEEYQLLLQAGWSQPYLRYVFWYVKLILDKKTEGMVIDES